MEGEPELEARKLAAKAKEVARDGKLKLSLTLFREAYQLFPTEKIKGRITKLQEYIQQLDEDEEEEEEEEEDDDDDPDPDMVDIGKQFFLHKSIANKLYDYQKQGVLWFWKLYNRKQGGILGDDMGLGKTIQVIAFMAGMFDAELIKNAIIVAPLSILINWEKEFSKWAGGIRIKPFHGNKKQRLKNLYKVQNSDGILITTYGMVVSNIDSLRVDENGDPFTWDYVILDEGHKIKNPTKTSKCVRQIPADNHFILSGTPIQNNLNEMWSLFDFTQQGQLLGTRKTFDMEFQKPIVRAREKDATEYQQQVGNKIAATLRKLIAPYFLRRTKAEVFKNNKKPTESDGKSEDVTDSTTASKNAKIPELSTRKNDLIVWVYLSQLQLKLYQGFVNSERVKECLMTTRSPLAELNLLKKISDHPRLQSTLSKLMTSSEEHETRRELGIEADERDDSSESTTTNGMPEVEEAVDAPPVEKLIQDSGKMVFLAHLMQKLKDGKHRTIIFSQSRKMLDIIQKTLLSTGHVLLRIDGTISNPLEREKIVQQFQTDNSITVMLMTTQVGSVGLTLTAADRLVIFDPSWNPGTDAQAVDRVYRVGQTKDVVIYRLITCGSIEEKIYRKQIFKNAVMKQATGSSNNPYRYFTNHQLRELFVLDDPRSSTTQQQLKEMHQYHNNTDQYFEQHLKFLENLDCIYGITHHDQLFSCEAQNTQSDEFQEAIDKQVNLAERRVREEFNDVDFSPRHKNKTRSTTDDDSVEYIKVGKKSPPSSGGRSHSPPPSPSHPSQVIDIDVSMRNLKIEEDDGDESNSTPASAGEERVTNVDRVSVIVSSSPNSNNSEDVSIQIIDSSSTNQQDSNEMTDTSTNQSSDPIVIDGSLDSAAGTNDITHSSQNLTDNFSASSSTPEEIRDHMGVGVDTERQECDIMQLNPSPRPPRSSSEQRNKSQNNEEQSSYEVQDMACSPFTADYSIGLAGQYRPNSTTDNSANQRELDSTSNSLMSNDINNSIGESKQKKSSLSSFIIDDEGGKGSATAAPYKLPPRVVQDLGKGYRTPPVSPVVSLLAREGAHLMARGSSTPLKAGDSGGVIVRHENGVGLDIQPHEHHRRKLLQSTLAVEECLSGLSLNNVDDDDSRGEVSQEHDANHYEASLADVSDGEQPRQRKATVPSPPHSDEFISEDDDDGVVEQYESIANSLQSAASSVEGPSVNQHRNTRNESNSSRSRADRPQNQSTNAVTLERHRSKNNETATLKPTGNNNSTFENNTNKNATQQSAIADVANDDIYGLSQEESDGISIHVSEESSASLYETRDVSCSPIKNSFFDENCDDVDDTKNSSPCKADTKTQSSSTSIHRRVKGSETPTKAFINTSYNNNSDNDDSKLQDTDDETASLLSSDDEFTTTTSGKSKNSAISRMSIDHRDPLKIDPKRQYRGNSSTMNKSDIVTASLCDSGEISITARRAPDQKESFVEDAYEPGDRANSSIFSSSNDLSKNSVTSNVVEPPRLNTTPPLKGRTNYAMHLGESPTSFSSARKSVASSVASSSKSRRRHSKASTFFDASITSEEENVPMVELGESPNADTQPIDLSQYFPASPFQHGGRSAASVVLEDGTPRSTTEDDDESGNFDLDRLKNLRHVESEKKRNGRRAVVVGSANNDDEKMDTSLQDGCHGNDKPEVIDDSMNLKQQSNSNVQPSDNEQEEEEEEMDQSKLRRLKSLLSKHMGNTEIPEKTLIRIVDLMDQLNI